MSTGAARPDRRLVTERALVALERGEDGAAILGVVPVLQQVAEHTASIARQRVRSHRGATLVPHPD